MTSSPAIRLASPDDRTPIVATVVAAFADDPAFNFFFPTTEIYAKEAPLFVGALFDDRIGQGATWVLDAADASSASLSIWAPPTIAAHGGADFSMLSAATQQRLDAYDTATSDGMPDTPIWYLGILATHPDHWGNRHGRELMKPGLAAAQESGIPAYLETTSDQNVAMYERSGWEVTAVSHLDDLTVTVLRHD